MRLELRHIKAFIIVAEELQFKSASDRLHMTQPALTRTIQSLEEIVGARLLDRTTRSVRLTEAGVAFLYECKQALSHTEKALSMASAVSEGNAGFIKIAYMDFAINGSLPDIIKRFIVGYSEIKIDLFHMPTSLQKNAILEDRIDIGFLIGPFDSPQIAQRYICDDELVVLLPVSHILTSVEEIDVWNLRDEKFIVGSRDSWEAFRTQLFSICHESGFTPKIIQEASTSDGIFGLVAANLGISIYSECVQNILRKGVIVRKLKGQKKPLKTYACWKKSNMNPALARFVSQLGSNPRRR